MDYKKIIDTYYPEGQNDALREILLVHSTGVATLAMEIIDKHPELQIDRDFVYTAAMLHDIGIVRCDAPGIQCFGTEPYICHGIIGARMLASLPNMGNGIADATPQDLERYKRVCARHTGAGITAKEIEKQNLPLPHIDLLPETLEEKLICYADKFYSKTHPERRKTFEKAEASMKKFGEDSYARFMALHELFK